MHGFDYFRPRSVQEAGALAVQADDARYLAGGQSLVPALKMRLASPTALIDLRAIGSLSTIQRQGNSLVIGAMATHTEVGESKEAGAAIPALASLALGIGDRQVRNRGTLGGALANNDPAACYPAAVLGLGATVQTSKRSIEAEEFFTGFYETALEPGELITSVSFPLPKRAAYVKFKNPASRFALVGVFLSQSDSGVRCAVTGAGSGVFRATKIEQALSKNFSPDALHDIDIASDDLSSDIHASSEYRAHLIVILARRAVAAALTPA
jgi:aerobic carbon-monoxide dehydrogenase medium subunit